MLAGLAVIPLVAFQGQAALGPAPFDRLIEVVLADQSADLDGRGPCAWIEHEIDFSGRLHLWTTSASRLDTFLRVEDAATGRLLAEDDDGGGGSTPYVVVEVEPGRTLAIAVAASQPTGRGPVELHLVASLETERTRAEAQQIPLELIGIQELQQRSDLENARQRFESLCIRLAGIPGGDTSALLSDLLWPCADMAEGLGLSESALALREQALQACLRRRPPDHDDLQWARLLLAQQLSNRGEAPRALELEERAVEVWARTKPPQDANLRAALAHLADSRRKCGDISGARQLQEQLLELLLRTLPGDHVDIQILRIALAASLSESGELPRAEELLEQALAVLEHQQPGQIYLLGMARGALALTLRARGDLRQALELHQQSLDNLRATRSADDIEVLRAQANMAGTLFTADQYAAARELFELALPALARLLPADNLELLTFRANLAAVYAAEGDLARKRTVLESVLELLAQRVPDDHPQLQRVRNNLALVLEHLGDHDRARALSEKALGVLSRTLPEDHLELQMARGALAVILLERDPSTARELLETALRISERTLPGDHPQIQNLWQSLATALHALHDLQGSRRLHQKALQALAARLPADHPELQVARHNLACDLMFTNDYPAARSLFEQVLEVRTRTQPGGHPHLQSTRLYLACTLLAQQPLEGEGSAERADAQRLLRDFLDAMLDTARLMVVSESCREAEERSVSWGDQIDQAWSLIRQHRLDQDDPQLARRMFLLSESTRSIGLLCARFGRFAGPGPERDRLRERIRSATDHLAALAQSGGSAEDFARARSELESAQRALVRLGSELDVALQACLQADLPALSAPIGEAQALVAYRRYSYRRLSAGSFACTPMLCAWVLRSRGRLECIELGELAPIEAAVAAWRDALGTEGGRGLALQSSAAPPLDLSACGEALRRLVLDPLRESLAGCDHVLLELDDVLHLVAFDALPAGAVWAPVVHSGPVHKSGASATAGSTSPDADDRVVPAGVLLGDRLQIDVALNLFLYQLGSGAPAQTPGGVILALGNPDFEGTPQDFAGVEAQTGPPAQEAAAMASRSADAAGILRGGVWESGFAALPATGVEVQAIAAHAGAGTAPDEKLEALVLERSRASRQSLTALAPRARYLHIATHGWFAPDWIRSAADAGPLDAPLGQITVASGADRVRGMSPLLLCGLALAGANRPADELGRIPGLITAEELGALDLSGCALAVLSACDTSVGLRRAGQGVASLQKALHMAGARNVITSLWKVPDEATKDLMIEFYRRLWVEHEPARDALWNAQMMLRNAVDASGRPRYSPRDWAAWVLTGEQD